MKKIAFIVAGCLFFSFAFSQDSTLITTGAPTKTANIKTIKFKNRPADHFMIQISSDHLTGMTDSISSHQKGFSRGFSAYFMLDKPFRSSPKFSLGIGAGISSSNIFFNKMDIDLNSRATLLPFTPTDLTNHFKKYKLAVSYLEIPLEFRYTSKPSDVNKSFKAALGIKVGTLANVHTKGKDLLDKNNSLITSNIEKENNKRYINTSRFMATARLGYGVFSLFGNYGLTNILKDGAGPAMKMYQVGITISGL
ncbi:MAG: PorT family protein [Bacteroidota bacterium]|nr:PorT family protein [Bacteroidota bacterium]